MTKVTINGNVIEVPDDASISVVGNQVLINGKSGVHTSFSSSEINFSNDLKIEIVGSPLNIHAERGSVSVKGNVAGNIDCNGSVSCGDVKGSIDCNGSINCGNVGGNIDAGGSVNCGDVGGDIDASTVVRR